METIVIRGPKNKLRNWSCTKKLIEPKPVNIPEHINVQYGNYDYTGINHKYERELKHLLYQCELWSDVAHSSNMKKWENDINDTGEQLAHVLNTHFNPDGVLSVSESKLISLTFVHIRPLDNNKILSINEVSHAQLFAKGLQNFLKLKFYRILPHSKSFPAPNAHDIELATQFYAKSLASKHYRSIIGELITDDIAVETHYYKDGMIAYISLEPSLINYHTNIVHSASICTTLVLPYGKH